jgi:hypothetical protein
MSGPPARPTLIAADGQAARDLAQALSRRRYLWLLGWAFSILSSARLLSYLPTVWAICASRDSSQHSLWTWGIWLGSNLTMALWLYEQQGQRWTKAATVNVVNATMCAATFTVILVFRF